MFSFTGNIVHASNTIVAEPISTNVSETYKFPYLEYPNVYIPNRSLAWTLVGLSEDSPKKQELRRQITDYNNYLHSLEEIDGFYEYFKKDHCCVTRSEIAAEFSDDVADMVFALPKCMFRPNIVIMQDYLIDTSVTVSYRANISGETMTLPIGKEADAYPSNIDGKKAIWNWVDNGHDFCYYLWDILGGRFNKNEDNTDSIPNYWGFDDYDQTRYNPPEPQLIRIFRRLENLGYIKTYTVKPSDKSPRWIYHAKADGSIDLALVDTCFLKNKLIMEQIELLLWSSEQDIREKPYFLTNSENKQFLSSIPGNIGGHNKLRIYGRMDCPSAARHIANGKYVQHRVFFADEKTAISAGYRPCAVCMPNEYKEWKARISDIKEIKAACPVYWDENDTQGEFDSKVSRHMINMMITSYKISFENEKYSYSEEVPIEIEASEISRDESLDNLSKILGDKYENIMEDYFDVLVDCTLESFNYEETHGEFIWYDVVEQIHNYAIDATESTRVCIEFYDRKNNIVTSVEPNIHEIKEAFLDRALDRHFDNDAGGANLACDPIEKSLYRFVKESKWQFGLVQAENILTNPKDWPEPLQDGEVIIWKDGERNLRPIMWYGLPDEYPLNAWTAVSYASNNESIWYEYDEDEIMTQILKKENPYSFNFWYLCECGCKIPDIAPIKESCPIKWDKTDTQNEFDNKISRYMMSMKATM